jgi:hypothetical protein
MEGYKMVSCFLNSTIPVMVLQKLQANRERFMTEKVILQYLGYVKTHMKLIEGGKHTGTPREPKLFYHVRLLFRPKMHKIYGIWCLA